MIACKCPNCGADIQVDETREFGFCTYCGTKVMQDKVVVEHSDDVKTVEEETESCEQQTDKGTTKENRNGKKSKLVAIAIIAVVIIVPLLILGILNLNGTSSANDGQSNSEQSSGTNLSYSEAISIAKNACQMKCREDTKYRSAACRFDNAEFISIKDGMWHFKFEGECVAEVYGKYGSYDFWYFVMVSDATGQSSAYWGEVDIFS